ncbi:hypothetical protein [Lysobacter sp. Root667]|uniref:hypothetical protein n=1 Tax=Lysobacter sp. Root667 TaxID=1736581 RepID=UPI0006FC72AD|nr:hypothetical protein [Lysobacter sp. Root667]
MALLALTLSAIGFLLHSTREVFLSQGFRPVGIHPGWAAVSVLLAVLHLVPLAWLFARCVTPSHQWKGRLVFMASQAAKYVPGKIWGVTQQRLMLGGSTSWKDVLWVNLFLMAIISSAQCASAAAALVILRQGAFAAAAAVGVLSLMLWLALLASGRVIAIFSPRFLLLGNWLKRHAGASTVAFLATTVFANAAWWSFYQGSLGQPRDAALGLVAVSGISVVAGFASVLPGGLGVREAVFVWLADFQALAPDGQLLALTLWSRIWLIAVDIASVTFATAGLALMKRQRKRHG